MTGEAPRVDARDLAPGAAQVCSNLQATDAKFRPVKAPLQVATATDFVSTVTSPKSLFRRYRGANGQPRTDNSTGWYASALDLNFVRWPSADDATERTAVSYNDGSAAPRASDITNEANPWPSRLLGVPKPAAPAVTLNAVAQFTVADAHEWKKTVYLNAIHTAFVTYLDTSLPNARFYSGAPTAGITSLPSPYALPTYPTSQRGKVEPWNVVIAVPEATAQLVRANDARLGGVSMVDGYHWLAFPALPFWGQVTNTAGFEASIGAIENPRYTDGTKLWSGAALTAVCAGLREFFNPATDDALVNLRHELDQAFVDFNAALYYALHSYDSAPATAGAKPELTDAAYAGWIYTPGYYAEGEIPAYKNAEYLDYESDLAAWKTANAAYDAFVKEADAANTKRVAAMVAAQAKAADISHQIEALFNTYMDGLMTRLSDNTDILGLVKSDTNPHGIIEVDPDPVVSTRYYAVTFVDDWGRESALSDPSAELTLDQNDTVTVEMPSVPAGRNITHWRLYRSLAGTETASFSFVEELTTSASTTRTIGAVSTTIYGYTDAKADAALGDAAITLGWDEPPVRATTAGITNTNPYLRGIAASPGGVVAGFLDNFVAFSEPNYPYAWPVKYQQPVHFPVVAVASFGQAWFVGTKGNPYIIAGDHPANYVRQKLDDAQPCLSARSVVSANGGVFFASPDGYCFVSQAGLQVFTQELFSQDDWQALDPSSIIAAVHENTLFFWYTGNGGGCYGLDFIAKKLVRYDMQATAVYRDVVTDGLFATYNGNVYRLFAGDRATGRWKSGVTVTPDYPPFAWLKVWGRQSADTPVTVKWYGDGVLRHTTTVTSTAPVRMPPGRWQEHELEIQSAARVTDIALAGSTDELKAIR